MRREKQYIYLVEGETEECLLKILMREKKSIISGKIKILNVIQERINNSLLIRFNREAVYVLIFDTDIRNEQILMNNIKLLKKRKHSIICIPQVLNFEDELVRACDGLNKIDDFYNCSKSEFKNKFLKDHNLLQKLDKYNFSIDKFWIKQALGIFEKYDNTSYRVKLNNKKRYNPI